MRCTIAWLLLACAVPLAGAVLLIVFADERMTLGFRLLVATLIGVGVAGVGIAERVTRRLRELAAIWGVQPRTIRRNPTPFQPAICPAERPGE